MHSFRVGVRANYNLCALSPSAPGITQTTCSGSCAVQPSSYGCDGQGNVTTFPAGVGACSSTTSCKCVTCDTSTYLCKPTNVNTPSTSTSAYTDMTTCATSCKPYSTAITYTLAPKSNTYTTQTNALSNKAIVTSVTLGASIANFVYTTPFRVSFTVGNNTAYALSAYVKLVNARRANSYTYSTNHQ